MVWRNKNAHPRGARGYSYGTLAAAFLVAASGVVVTTADAGQITRPIRDTSSRTVTSTGKVLIAAPHGHHVPRMLHRATRDYHGHPVRCGVGLHEPAKLVVARLPTWHRYNAAYSVCGEDKGNRGLQTFRKSDVTGKSAGKSSAHDHTAAPTPTEMAGPVTVIAAGKTRYADLPATMRGDGWALLDAGRYRDAARVFDADDDNLTNRAGLAIATAMSGDLDGGADALADLGGNLDALRSVEMTDAVKSRLAALADALYEDRPDVQRVLNAMAGTDMPDAA